MRFIGDIHGKFDQYLNIIGSCTESIQVGDFGAGFKPLPNMRPLHKFIRGNHDSPAICASNANWIADGTMYGGIFCLGGAVSIDAHSRTEGVSWWRDEECSIVDLNTSIDAYIDAKPDIVVTHDCPELVMDILFKNTVKRDFPSRTRQALQAMFEEYQPALWIFGHHHRSRNQVIDGTKFICLAELEYTDIG